jgi:hypothetical protein
LRRTGTPAGVGFAPENEAIATLAGTYAERLVTWRVSSESWEADRRRAWDWIGPYCGSQEEVEAYLALLNIRARGLAQWQLYRPALDARATALLERRRISGRAARKIIRSALSLATRLATQTRFRDGLNATKPASLLLRRGGRAVECGGLENR